MGTPVTDFIPFDETRYGDRYEFDYEGNTIYDTKFKRVLVAGCKRGGRPYYRLVDAEDEATHVRAEDIFGASANDDVSWDSDFDPADFADRYDFDFDTPAVIGRGSKGQKAGEPLTLRSPNGWRHWFLTRNDGQRVRVTPAEVIKAGQRDEWVVPAPKGSITLKIFPNHAFLKDGTIVRIRRDHDGDHPLKPLLRPEPLAVSAFPDPGTPNPDAHTFYEIRSSSGQLHKFSRQSIKDAHRANPKLKKAKS